MVHPLIDQCVPNSIHTSNSTARVHIVTGANQGGKSVLLKALGIVVYLSQLGCFVPCSSARLSIADAIYTKMRTMESVQQGVSAFAADCTSLARMLNDASPQSLLLIDEFGVGTDSADGTALFAAVVRHYSRTSPQSPLVWMTTHFTDAIGKHAQLLSSATRPCDAQEQHLQTNSSTDAQHSNNQNLNETRWIEEEEVEEADSFAHVAGNGPTKQGAQSCLNESLHGSDHATVTLTATSPTHEAKVYTMKTLVDKSREGNQRIAFLYELVEGLKLGSFGIEVAQAVGLPQHIIDMAKSLSLDE
jgi:DNA mismatch repair ATPase MutS